MCDPAKQQAIWQRTIERETLLYGDFAERRAKAKECQVRWKTCTLLISSGYFS
jgi:hypothetical protein